MGDREEKNRTMGWCGDIVIIGIYNYFAMKIKWVRGGVGCVGEGKEKGKDWYGKNEQYLTLTLGHPTPSLRLTLYTLLY